LVVLAVLLLTISLGLVGFALDATFHRSTEAGLKSRMESLVYLVLAASDVGDNGLLIVKDDPGDPRLGQPGSGIYARVHGDLNEWVSPSSLAVGLPDLPRIPAGDNSFTVQGSANGL